MEQRVAEQWRKATYSQSNGGSCVEVGNGIKVRDTTQAEDPNRTTLEISARAWSSFTTAIR